MPMQPRDFLTQPFCQRRSCRRSAERHQGAPSRQAKAGRTVVIGAGKGAAQMAQALETVWDGPLEGVVVTRYGYGCETQTIEIIEARIPFPMRPG
jgi:glycerate 2-kinase